MLPIATPGVIKFIAFKVAGCGSRLDLLKEKRCLTMLIGEHHRFSVYLYMEPGNRILKLSTV